MNVREKAQERARRNRDRAIKDKIADIFNLEDTTITISQKLTDILGKRISIVLKSGHTAGGELFSIEGVGLDGTIIILDYSTEPGSPTVKGYYLISQIAGFDVWKD